MLACFNELFRTITIDPQHDNPFASPQTIEDSFLEDEQPSGKLPVTVVLAVLNCFFLGLLFLLVSTVFEDPVGGILLAINCWICIFGGSILFLGFRTIWSIAITYFGILFLTCAGLCLASFLGVVAETWAMLTLPGLVCGLGLILLAFPGSRRYYGHTNV